MLTGLQLGQHDKAEWRIHRLFLPLDRASQRAVLEVILCEAATTEDNETRILARSLIEAADWTFGAVR